MKLEPDAVRDLLLEIERDQQGHDWELDVDASDYPKFYTAKKLLEAGYINANLVEFAGGGVIGISELTITGHEFLDNTRDPSVCTRTKGPAAKVVSCAIDLLLTIR